MQHTVCHVHWFRAVIDARAFYTRPRPFPVTGRLPVIIIDIAGENIILIHRTRIKRSGGSERLES